MEDEFFLQEPGWFGVSLHLELGFRGSAIGYKILQKEGKADVEVEENYRGRYECHNRVCVLTNNIIDRSTSVSNASET